MEKFLKFPISGSTYRILSITGVLLVTQASATTTTLTYKNPNTSVDVVTITHASVSNDDFRDFVQKQIEAALQTSWAHPVYTVKPPVAVSNITVA
jgi:hypothetical protein